MSDWLSRIEKFANIDPLWYKDRKRMARVIREYIEGLEILKELYLQPEYRMTDDQTVDMKNFFDGLSPDAKELLNVYQGGVMKLSEELRGFIENWVENDCALDKAVILVSKVAQLEAALMNILLQTTHVDEENEDWVRPWLEWQNIKAIAEKALMGEIIEELGVVEE